MAAEPLSTTPSAERTPVIELDGLGVRFGRHQILSGLTARLTGRAIGLLGPNGAGKTTLINTLLGFYPPSEGTARLFGRDIRTEAKDLRGAVGYMPETDSFIAQMSCVRFVRLMGELSGLPPDAALERAHEALHYVGLGEARYRPLEGYSQGMKQLAKLAQGIVHGPRLLFLDEPTNGLDPPARERMLRLIRDIRDEGELCLILSSHLLRDVEECCEEVLILKKGEIATYCDLAEERRTNRRLVELEIRGNAEPFAAAVSELGCEGATLNQKRLKVVVPEGLAIADLFRLADQHEVQLRRVGYKRDSLEDIFLKAMGDHNGRV